MGILSIYYQLLLPEEDRDVYDRILASWLRQDSVVVLPRPTYRLKKDASEIVHAVALDHPEVFWVDYYHFTQRDNIFSSSLVFDYYFDEKKRLEAERIVFDWKTQLVNSLSAAAKAVEKYRILYEYLKNRVVYSDRCKVYGHTMLGCVPQFGQSAVCEGIAKCYKYLCNAVGLPCIVIEGTINIQGRSTAPHAWNMIPGPEGFRYVDILNPGLFMKSKRDMHGYNWERR